MSDIELVIKIPGDKYREIYFNYNYNRDSIELNDYEKMIAEGIPLPEKHGRLIDESQLMLKDPYLQERVAVATTIIESDKE